MKVKDLFEISKGKKEITCSVKKGTRYIQIEDLRGDEFVKYCKSNRKSNFVSKNDILIVWDGANAGTIGYGLEGVIGSTIAKLKTTSDSNFIPYLGQFLKTKSKYLRQNCTGATIPHISKNVLNNIDVPLPPLPVQVKIAEILDWADAIRQNYKKILEKYDQLAHSVFYEMFGDPVINPKVDRIVKLTDITTKITDGVHEKPKYIEEGVPFVSVKDITTGKLSFDKCKYISETDHRKYIKRCKPELNDILYTKVGATYGRPAIVDQNIEFSIYVSVALIKPNKDIVNPYFLREALACLAIKRQADKSIKGIGVPDLHLNMIKDFVLPLPDLRTQKKFANIILQIEEQRSLIQTNFQKSEELFQSLLQRVFKGELIY